MHLDRYSFSISENFLDYSFFSQGPKGCIKKIVRFTPLNKNLYNLAFGDLNESTGDISDMVVTNNSDSRKVLITVAATVHDFTLQYPTAIIFLKGSTHSRTRLYRIGITNHADLILTDFQLYGLIDSNWELFQLNRNYEAFLVHRK